MFKTTCSRLRASRILWLSAAIVLLASSRVLAAGNLVLLPVEIFTGTVDSVPVNVPLNGGQTGPISLALDSTATNVFGLDNVLGQGAIDVTLLLNSELFTLLGETPRIRIQESGPATVTLAPPGSGFDFTFHAELTGGGTVENGLFAGTMFQNLNIYEGDGLLGSWIVQPFTIVTWNIAGAGSVTFPDGTKVAGIGGSGYLVVTPEPSSLTLSGFGMAAIVVLLHRRSRAKPR
ncbi:MAG: PEP-CTERM sorting domain-containing protein [Planctomycetia bacterium]|nr:PEP-CTERM sorting domain-containing protein [Planctomycetia bacterium]